MAAIYWLPTPCFPDSSLVQTYQVNAATYAVGSVFRCPFTGTIDRIGAYCTAAVATPTMIARLETVAAGVPSGTLANAAGLGSLKSFTPVASTFAWHTLEESYSATEGDLVAATILHSAGDATFRSGFDYTGYPAYPRTVESNGAWSITDDMPSIIPRYAVAQNDYIPFGFCCPTSFGNLAGYKSGDAVSEHGNVFTPGADCSLVGILAAIRADTTASDLEICVYDGESASDGNEIGVAAYDATHIPTTLQSVIYHEFSGAIALTGGQEYRVSVRATTANNIRVKLLEFPAAELLTAFRPGMHQTKRGYTDATWSDVTTNQVYVYPILGQLSAGVSGMKRTVGMAGSMRG